MERTINAVPVSLSSPFGKLVVVAGSATLELMASSAAEFQSLRQVMDRWVGHMIDGSDLPINVSGGTIHLNARHIVAMDLINAQ